MRELIVLQITLFSMVGLGLLVRRLGIVSEEGQKSINRLVINLVLPCNIVQSFVMDLNMELLHTCVWVFVISAAVQVFAVLYGRALYGKKEMDRQISLRYGIICSNAGFLGNPIAEGIYGAEGLILANIFLIPVRVMMWSAGIALYEGQSDGRQVVKKVLTHPCVIACAIGFCLFILQITPPAFILTPLKTVGRCNTALSMMVIGMILAAMPAGATTSMLAENYGRDPAFATKLVITSTLLSLPTVFLWSLVTAL